MTSVGHLGRLLGEHLKVLLEKGHTGFGLATIRERFTEAQGGQRVGCFLLVLSSFLESARWVVSTLDGHAARNCSTGGFPYVRGLLEEAGAPEQKGLLGRHLVS